MYKKRFIALFLAVIIVTTFSSCKKDSGENTSPTFSGGSVEDVFNLSGDVKDGEDPTIDGAMVDGDSGKVTTGKSSTKTTAVKHDVKNETTISGNVSATETAEGYKVTWKAVNGAKGYNVYRAPSKDGEYVFLGTTTNTYYLDKSGSNKYTYKITLVTTAQATTTVKNSANFKGANLTFTGKNGERVYVSTALNNLYVAYIRNQYAANGINCPPGRLAYVTIKLSNSNTYTCVFQFDNSNKNWGMETLEQVHYFADANDTSKYFSFFTKDTGTKEYLAAKATAEKEWEKNRKDGSNSYTDVQALFIAVAGTYPEGQENNGYFKQVINASYN